MPEVNYLAVGAAALSAFLLGGLWYSPLVFAKPWMAYAGIECGEDGQPKSGNMVVIFGGAFVLNLIAAFVLAMFLGPMPLKYATLAGLRSACAGSRPVSASITCSNAGLSACG